MQYVSLTVLLIGFVACSEATDTHTDTTPSPNPITESEAPTTDGAQPGSTDEPDQETEPQWGDIVTEPAYTFFASDLSEAVQIGITDGLAAAARAWGNYGPLEYWVLGTDEQAGMALIEQFCERREERGEWSKSECMNHHTRENSDHNLLSYLRVGQEVLATQTPMGTAGRNGRREWGIHLFTSSYPFAFDQLFEGILPEEETKTVFHEYFHAVQHAHIFSFDYEERDLLLGPTWFVEGGAEYMAQYTTSKMWASGELPTTPGEFYPTFQERMEWKLIGGQENLEQNCPGMSLADITYADPCSYAAYELGAWAHAYLQHLAGEEAHLNVFWPRVEDLGWEDAFKEAFGMTSADFYTAFDTFLALPRAEQLLILADI